MIHFREFTSMYTLFAKLTPSPDVAFVTDWGIHCKCYQMSLEPNASLHEGVFEYAQE